MDWSRKPSPENGKQHEPYVRECAVVFRDGSAFIVKYDDLSQSGVGEGMVRLELIDGSVWCWPLEDVQMMRIDPVTDYDRAGFRIGMVDNG